MGRAWLGSLSRRQPQGAVKGPELCHLHSRWADSGLLRQEGIDLLSLGLSLNPNDKDETEVQKFQNVTVEVLVSPLI